MHRIARSLLLSIAASSVVGAAPDPAVRALIEQGHFKQAKAALEPRVSANPNDAEAAALLSQVRLVFGNRDDAVRLAEIAVRLEGRNADYHWQLAQAVGEQAQHAGMLKQFGLARRFKQEAETTLALDATHIEARMGMISFYIEAPGIVGGDRKKAEQMVDEIAQIDAGLGSMARAQLVIETKGSEDLEPLYRKAVETARTPSDAYDARDALMGRYLAGATPRLDLAESQARELLKLGPHRQSGYSGLAIVFSTSDRFAELDALLESAERTIPDNLNPAYQAARVLQTRGSDLPRAERYFRKYLSQPPEGSMPPLANTHWRLGLTLEKEGRKAEAIAEMEQAVALNPDLEPARKDLKRLR